MKVQKVQAGWYTATVDGMEFEFVSHGQWEGGDPRTWNLLVNGRCDDCYYSLADAKAAALVTVRGAA